LTGSYAEVREELARALYGVPLMLTEKDAIRRELRIRGFEVASPASRNHRVQCNEILDDVLARAGALNELVRVLLHLDGSDRSRELQALGQRVLPETYLTLEEKFDIASRLNEGWRRENFGRYYRAIVKHDAAERIHDATELVFQIGRNAPRVSGAEPLIHLIALAAKDAQDPGLAREYTERAEYLATRIDQSVRDEPVSPSQMEHLRTIFDAPEPALLSEDDDSVYIVLRLDPWNASPLDCFLLTSWLYYGDELIRKLEAGSQPLGLAEAKSAAIKLINAALEIAEQRGRPCFSTVIEFILPRDEMNLAVESWSLEEDDNVPLGMQFVVVIRDLHRQKSATQRTVWRERWDCVGDGSRLAEEVITKWFACSEMPFHHGELYRHLKKEKVSGAGLTFPPELPIHEFRIGEMLNTGLPIAVWPHSCCHAAAGGKRHDKEQADAFKEAVCRLSYGHPIRELPELVRELRVSVTEFDDAASGIALLWDDPSRVVRPDDFELSIPAESGAHQ
jgi:vWA-MoxR associated protein C-terminal domain